MFSRDPDRVHAAASRRCRRNAAAQFVARDVPIAFSCSGLVLVRSKGASPAAYGLLMAAAYFHDSGAGEDTHVR